MTEERRETRGTETSKTDKQPAGERSSGEPRQSGGADPRDRRVEAGRKTTSTADGSGHAR